MVVLAFLSGMFFDVSMFFAPCQSSETHLSEAVMSISIFRLFKVGLGPSSSHTSGPMEAANTFLSGLALKGGLERVCSLSVTLYGSLALTGRGHGTDKAIVGGLLGYLPGAVTRSELDRDFLEVSSTQRLSLLGVHEIPFHIKKDMSFRRGKSLSYHPNGMVFEANMGLEESCRETFYSVGGGFVVKEGDTQPDPIGSDSGGFYRSFSSAFELLKLCQSEKLSIPELVLANECCYDPEEVVREKISKIWQVMETCISLGCSGFGELPGGLGVKRRAGQLYKDLSKGSENVLSDPLATLDWVNLYALAVSEQNAAGETVVTAPTNGAAGIVPAVIKYYMKFHGGNEKGVQDFFLAAGAIGSLFQQNASISGAEVGCQGEVGVASSMAAAGITAALGGNSAHVTQAAEIAMEHNLGLTCDPIGGLVQIPCIERNAMGAVKALNACRMALRGHGEHFVSLDSVIKTMRDTGADMKSKYKETSRGGLAVNVVDC
mgnify:CR=1 FL=1